VNLRDIVAVVDDKIAQRLNIGVKTVEDYRASLKAKMRAASTLELVVMALQAAQPGKG
jgi:FixJ family two-component response regulator